MPKLVTALAASLALLALPSAGCSAESPSDKAFGERVRAYLLAHPEVLEEAMTRLQTSKDTAAAAGAKAALTANRKALERDPRDFVAGNPNGAVTVVEFFDYRCPYCKISSPATFKYLAAHKDVRLVLKEFPILSESSEHAARVAIAAKASGKYQAVHQQLLAEKSLDDETIDGVLRANGLDPKTVRAAGQAPAVTAQIADTRALAKAVDAGGTPTFIIGDKVIPGWIEADVDAAIAEARKGTR